MGAESGFRAEKAGADIIAADMGAHKWTGWALGRVPKPDKKGLEKPVFR
jgi:hypothetical protein